MQKVAIVTGAASGIGLAIVRKMLNNGCAVVGMSRRSTAEDLGVNFTYLSGDISLAEDRQSLVEKAISQYGHIDFLINAAGVAPKVRSDLLDMSQESFERVMKINLQGPFFLTQNVARRMAAAAEKLHTPRTLFMFFH